MGEKSKIKIEESSEKEGGFEDTSNFMKKNVLFSQLSVRYLLYAAILGVMGGFISSLVPFSLPIKMIYPFMGGTQLVSGHHTIWMAIAYGMTKNKLSPILTGTIKGIFEALLGDAWGAFIIVINLIEAVTIVLCFWIAEKMNEDYSKLGWAIACGVGNFIQAPIFWFLTGRIFVIHYTLAILAFIFVTMSKEKYDRFYAFTEEAAQILECHCVSGEESFLLRVMTGSVSHLDNLIEKLGEFGETKTSIVLSSYIEKDTIEIKTV